MILEYTELSELYEAVIKPFGHPDPLGFMTRALLVSEGDPDYIDMEGKQGFQPVLPSVAMELTGAQEVQSLQANVAATLSMDKMYFEKYGNIEDMIISFHFGEEGIFDAERTKEQKDFIAEVDEGRSETLQIMYPPFATVADVIKLLNISNTSVKMSKKEADFFDVLLKGT